MASARRRSGGGPGFFQWLMLGGAVVVILGLTFALGLLVGRQLARSSIATATPPSVSEAARKAATPASRRGGIAAETMADRPPEPTEKLTFYQTLTEPLNGAGAAKPDSKPVNVPVTVKVSAPSPAPVTPPAAAPAPTPAPTSPSLPPAPGKAAPAAKAPPTPAAATSPWTVQVGAFKNRRQAEDIRHQLVSAGLEAYVASVAAQDGQPRFRVRVGTYRSREEAAAAAERIRAQRSVTAFATPK
jgi:cell division protein FtsN